MEKELAYEVVDDLTAMQCPEYDDYDICCTTYFTYKGDAVKFYHDKLKNPDLKMEFEPACRVSVHLFYLEPERMHIISDLVEYAKNKGLKAHLTSDSEGAIIGFAPEGEEDDE